MLNKYILNTISLTCIFTTIFLLCSGYTLKENARPEIFHKLLKSAENEKEIIARSGQTNGGDCKDSLHRMRREINAATETFKNNFKNKEEEAKFEQFKKKLGKYMYDLRLLGYTKRLEILRNQIQGKMYQKRQEMFMANILKAAKTRNGINKNMPDLNQMNPINYANTVVPSLKDVLTRNKFSGMETFLNPKTEPQPIIIHVNENKMLSLDEFRQFIDKQVKAQKNNPFHQANGLNNKASDVNNQAIHVNNQANQTRT